ncbi:MAG: choice-of-anchor L domain-containing protein [Phycisphaerales bacterium]
MKSTLLTLVTIGAASQFASAQITPMTDPSGAALIARLFENSGVSAGAVQGNSVQFVGQVAGGTQSGLLSGLVIHGAGGTSQTLGSGVVLSSGLVHAIPTTNTTWAWSNITHTGGNNYFRDFPAQTGTTRHGGRLQEHDENEITFDLDVPEGVVGVSADFVYASEEFPEWSGTGYADGFAFIVDNVNYARLPDGRPVSLLSQNDNVHFMTNGDSMDAAVPRVLDMEYDGATRILELTAPLQPGHRQTFTIVVADTGDEIYDSAVFLSSLRFITGTTPPTDDDCHVHVRHHSSDDDSYVEFGAVTGSACDSIDFNADGLFPDTADIDDFLSVFSGGACPTGACGDIDFNNDGLFPDTSDIDSLLSVFSGGACL